MSVDAAPRLILGADHHAALRAAAEAAYPEEFCALLVGVDEPSHPIGAGHPACRVTRIVPARNVDPHPRAGFEVDPRVLIAVLRELRDAERSTGGVRERLLGHAHSHPGGPASPSARDLALAHEPGLIWVILDVHDGFMRDMGAFQAVEDGSGKPGFRETKLVI